MDIGNVFLDQDYTLCLLGRIFSVNSGRLVLRHHFLVLVVHGIVPLVLDDFDLLVEILGVSEALRVVPFAL